MAGKGLMRSPAVLGAALCLAVSGLPACRSRDDRAATAAAIAADALQNGDLATAGAQIGRALAARDDNSDYWLLSGRIAIAQHDFAGAFSAFETAATLDHSNLEALTRLCQLAASSGQPDRAARYADTLAALRPGDPAAVNVQAAIAAVRGDRAKATELLDRLLAADPNDATALLTRSRLLFMRDDYAGAAKAAEASLTAPGDPAGRLQMLQQIYRKAGDAAGYRRTVERLARADPRSVDAQLALARNRYDNGDRTGALAATRAALALKPGDVTTAGTVLHLWLAQGAAAMPIETIVAAASGAVPETRAAFAFYATARGRPDLALAALGDAGAGGSASTATNDAMIARAGAQALLGQREAAMATATAVLAADPDQPRALALRGRLRGAAGDGRGAVEDLRHALAADPADADTRLALADLQLAGGDPRLAAGTLRDGLGEPGADPRLATRLAALLRRDGNAASAAAAITDYARLNPFAPRPPA